MRRLEHQKLGWLAHGQAKTSVLQLLASGSADQLAMTALRQQSTARLR